MSRRSTIDAFCGSKVKVGEDCVDSGFVGVVPAGFNVSSEAFVIKGLE